MKNEFNLLVTEQELVELDQFLLAPGYRSWHRYGRGDIGARTFSSNGQRAYRTVLLHIVVEYKEDSDADLVMFKCRWSENMAVYEDHRRRVEERKRRFEEAQTTALKFNNAMKTQFELIESTGLRIKDLSKVR